MDRIVVKCEKCGEIGFATKEGIDKKNNCNGRLIKQNISYEDGVILCDISEDDDFLQAMIDLKEKDIIEYNLKMSQFKNQVEQQQNIKKQQQKSSKPHCPTCNSTNIKPITEAERAASIIGLGVFSKKINKTYKCLNCKCTW